MDVSVTLGLATCTALFTRVIGVDSDIGDILLRQAAKIRNGRRRGGVCG